MRRSLHRLLLLAFAAGLPVTEAAAQSTKYPDRPIRIVIGFSAGGGTDVAGRILAQKMTESMGQTVVVENRPGASGMIAGEAVAKSAPDGYTLMLGSQTTFAVAPILFKVSLDPARDFAGIAMCAVSLWSWSSIPRFPPTRSRT
jgi:tripartite-type tricarboxylate transporter receptor subunit TctC